MRSQAPLYCTGRFHMGSSLKKKRSRKMFLKGIIVIVWTELATPTVFEPKKNGFIRFSADYQKPDAVIKQDVFLILRLTRCIDSFGKGAVFCMPDAKSVYWEVESNNGEAFITAATWQDGPHCWVSVPPEIWNALTTFQLPIDVAVFAVKWQFETVCRDGIVYLFLFYSGTNGSSLTFSNSIDARQK